MDATVARVSDLRVQYGDLLALDDVSVDVKAGEFFALLGPSGCGKTTLLRAIGGFAVPKAGQIIIDGIEMTDAPPYERPVNMVFQNYALFPHMTVRNNIAYGLRRKRLGERDLKERVGRMLATVGLEAFADRYPAQLSGGQQQRVALARAIVNEPKLLLLDEPLSALDLKLKKRMQLELKQLQHTLGIAFIMVTHDQEEALFLADRIAVMDSGRIMQVGSGREIYHNPSNRFVADFIGETNLIPCKRVSSTEWEIIGEKTRFHSEGPSTDTAYLNIRPEDLLIFVGQSSDTGPIIQAKVDQTAFVGGGTRAFVTSTGGHKLTISAASSSDIQLGAWINVRLNLEHSMVLAQ